MSCSSSDPLYGGAPSIEGSLSPFLLTINVTALTKDRLITVLQEAKRVGATFIALQETRHRKASCPWASRMLASYGWKSVWSEPPPLQRQGSPRQGGTALLWRSGERSAPFVPSLPKDQMHRVCGSVFRDFAVVCVYGPASSPDPALIAAVLRQATDLQRPVLMLGDFNWRSVYQPLTDAVGAGFFPVIGTVLGSEAAPTRCFSLGEVQLQGAESSANALAGIPHHKAICYRGASFRGSLSPSAPRSRYRRTASYKWSLVSPASLSDSQLQRLREASLEAPDADASLPELFRAWHNKAEAACQAAVSLGLACLERPGERSKGSEPTTKPCSQAPQTRQGETVSLRRWRRLHRAAAEQARRSGDKAPLTESQLRHWKAQLVSEAKAQLVSEAEIPRCQGEALQRASSAVSAQEQDMSRQSQLRWRRKFSVANCELLKVAAGALRPETPCGGSVVDSAAMTQEWAPRWESVHPNPKEAWQEVLRKSASGPSDGPLPQHEQQTACAAQPEEPWVPITIAEFQEAIRTGKGSAGFDGWSAKELAGLSLFCPWLISELVQLFNACMMLQSSDKELLSNLRGQVFAWKVVGIPKRGEEATRPIAVTSALVRAFNKALLARCPDAPDGQLCGLKDATVASATLKWLDEPACRGAEMDLRKAFDSVDLQVADFAAETAGVPGPIRAYMQHLVWRAPRACTVSGSPPPYAISATCGLPQGDPCSPRFLSYVLGPWYKLMRSVPNVGAFLYCDDRSLTDRRTQNGLETALQLTRWHDEKLGLTEHLKKRQTWSRQSGRVGCSVEHLGITTSPGYSVLPQLRVGADDLCTLAAQVQLLPGGADVKQGLLAGIVLPKLLWAAPLMPEVPERVVKAFFHAFRGHNTWWCQARVWADSIHCHPKYAAAIRCLKTAAHCAATVSNPVFWKCVKHHANVLGFELGERRQGNLWLQPLPSSEPRLVAAARRAAAVSGSVDGQSFRPDADKGHCLRVAARICALTSYSSDRHDVENIGNIDVELQSHPRWKAWRKTLSVRHAYMLVVWRGGATKSATRRHWRPGRLQFQAEKCACAACGYHAGSTHHLFAECPRFSAFRSQLALGHQLPQGWFRDLPRVTSKSGWVCQDAADDMHVRVSLQIAASRLGIEIVAAGGEIGD